MEGRADAMRDGGIVLSEESILKYLEGVGGIGKEADTFRPDKTESDMQDGESRRISARSAASVQRQGNRGDYAVCVGRCGDTIWKATIRPDDIESYALAALDVLPDHAGDDLRAELRWLARARANMSVHTVVAKRLATILRDACKAGLDGEWTDEVPDDSERFFVAAFKAAARRDGIVRVTGESIVLRMMATDWDEGHGGKTSTEEKALVALREAGLLLERSSDEDMYMQMVSMLPGFADGHDS